MSERLLIALGIGSFAHGSREDDIAADAKRGVEPRDEIGERGGEVPTCFQCFELDAGEECDFLTIDEVVREVGGCL